jgi:cardiolipin synthase A/B
VALLDEPNIDHDTEQQQAGTSSGINREPGSNDDGWIVPPPVTLSDGSRIQLFKDGEALRAAYDAIEAAKYRICLEAYIFAGDSTREGLHVYVIYDSFGSWDTPRAMFHSMKKAGVHIQEFHPIRPWDVTFGWRPANRDHRKLLVVDYDTAGMGGLNIGLEYAGSWVVNSSAKECDLWRDNAIGIRGPAAKWYLRAFARMWHYCAHGGRFRVAEMVHNIIDAREELGLLATVPTLNSPLRPMLHRLFRSARKRLQMTMAYFAPDDPLIDELCRAARRGVRVQLMLPGRCDVRPLLIAARSFYEKLMTAGVEIYERQGVVLHAKTMVIDGRITVIGSTNLDYRSIEYNCELSTVLRNDEFGAQMCRLFENDIQYAKRIRLSEWRRRPMLDRCGQWCVSRARYLL